MELNGGMDNIKYYEDNEIRLASWSVEFISNYLRENTAEADIRKGVFSLFALWRSVG